MKICNQCLSEMKSYLLAYFDNTLFYCFNPKCPNYALIQIPLEDMPKGEESILSQEAGVKNE